MTTRTPQVGVRLAVLDGKIVERELKKFGREGEQALSRIQRSSRPARKSLKAVDAAVSELSSSAVNLSSNLGAAGAGLRAMGPAGVAAAVGIGAITLGLAKVVSSSRDAARSIAEVGDAARRAGVDVEPFQELQIVAERNRISIDALTDGFKELNLRADEFIFTGGGPATEAFQRLGFGAEELRDKLQDPSGLLVEIIGRLEKFDRAAQIRISDELFGGTAGERFVELIDRGSDNVQSIIEESRELGLIFDQEVVSRAEDLDSELTRAYQTVDRNLKRALLDVAPAAERLSYFLATSIAGLSSLVDLTRDVEDQQTGLVQEKYITLLNRRAEALERLRDLEKRSDPRFDPQIKTARDDIARFDKDLKRIQAVLDKRSGYRPDFEFDPVVKDTFTESVTEADRTAAEAWQKRILTVAEKRKKSLEEINRLEKLGQLTAEEASRARVQAEEAYASAIKKTGKTGRQAEAKLLREVQSLLKASATPAAELQKRLQRIAELQGDGVFDRASGGNGEAAANAARVQAMREYLGAAEDTAVALERLQELAQSGLGADALAAQVTLAERAGKSFGETMTEVSDRVSDGLTDAMFAAGEQAESFGDIMKRLALQLARDFANMQLRGFLGQITGGFSGGGSSIFSSLLGLLTGRGSASSAVMTATAGIYHDGGKIGPGGRTRQVPMSLFANAERRHNGGFIKPGERPIIAEDGERVLTMAMQKNAAQTISSLASLAAQPSAVPAAASQAPVINIYAPPGMEVETQQRQSSSGGLETDVLIREVDRGLASRITDGTSQTAKAISNRFALNRANALSG
ncbi:MAG: hypothetical protein K5905_12065 [Roseibium sp.]|uniref:hypothetical protein n=1 Tax=Roseibium sp. TaxID=1936156 RepID=UPI0026336FB0|nr:hypothetical protein [Roseibium sp.]MCV0426202.1 hypothetical protein [Roseibium sp.]